MPITKLESKSSTNNSVLGVVSEIKQFTTEPLAQKKEDLEKIVSYLEEVLQDVLIPEKDNDAKTSGCTALRSDSPSSPLHSLLTTVKDDLHDTHEFLERIRNKISGLIDRVHLK